MLENLSIGHLAVVLVIFLLLFGAKRIPEIAGSLGQGINEFKKNLSGVGNETTVLPPSATRDSVPLPYGTPSLHTKMQATDIEREPKRLL